LNTKKFPARLDTLHQMLQWIHKQIKSVGFEVSDLRKIELASEEALVNVIKHGYKNESAGFIELSVVIHDNDKMILTIRDKGLLFNPLKQEAKVDLESPLEQRLEGGLGILMMRQYMDQINYKRDGEYNLLTMIKKISY